MARAARNVRYWGKADNRILRCTCPLMTQSGHRPVFPCVLANLHLAEFEKWSILNRLGCQTGSALESGAFHPPRTVERPSQPPLVGCYVCVLSPARNVGLFF